jgi:hypothetical protein
VPTVPVCTQAPNDGTLFNGKEEEYLICAREERAKPIGDRRAGRWSPAMPLGMAPVCRTGQSGAGAEAGRGLWPRGFSRGPELETSEPEAEVAARLMTEPREARAPCASGTRLARAEQALGPKGWLEDASPETMRRDGRSFGAMIFRKPERETYLPRPTKQPSAGFRSPTGAKGGTGPAGTIPPEPSGARPKRPRGFSVGPERKTSEPEAGVAARLMRRDGRSSSARISRKSELGTYLSRSTK